MFKRELFFIDTNEQLEEYLTKIRENEHHNIIPIISISCKTGENVDRVRNIFKIIPKNTKAANNVQMKEMIMYIDMKYNISGAGIVLSGSLWNKRIEVNNNYYIGPIYFPSDYLNGYVEDYKKKTHFYSIRIRSIHNNDRQMVEFTDPNNVANICIKFNNSKETLTLNQIRKGLIISDVNMSQHVFFKFKALIKIFNTNTTNLRVNYQPVLHCRTIRQTARILEVKQNEDKHNEYECIFQFTRYPEILETNLLFFFREGSTKGIGKILELID
jgi:elongation factor 1-alpha